MEIYLSMYDTNAPSVDARLASGSDTMDELRDYTLPDDLAAIADAYEATMGHRNTFLWEWFHCLNPHFRLSTVQSRYERKVQDDKTLLTFYVTLLDDLIDSRNDRVTFQEVAKLPFDESVVNRGSDADEACFALAEDVWEKLDQSLRTAPRFEEFREVFEFDLRQTLNAIRHSYIVNNNPYVTNMTEAYAYGSHNMAMLAFADIDLMHSTEFDRGEFCTLRTVLWAAQAMARIGNWVSTWKRELREGDCTSGVLVDAYERGIVSAEEMCQLRMDPSEEMVASVTERIEREGVEARLLAQWQEYYDTIECASKLESVDVDALLTGMETVMRFHLASEGRK